MTIEQLEKRYQLLQKELGQIGYICSGTIMSLFRKCGKPNCHCQEDPESQHGPYYIWTRKEKGRTITRSLSEEKVKQCSQCIQNYERLKEIIEEMKKISARIVEYKTLK